MMSAAPLSGSRLAPPRLPEWVFPRRGLVARSATWAERRLVSVVAGAGWGKTFLLALAAAEAAEEWAWLSIDESMRAPPLLFAYLVAALATRLPGFGSGLSPMGPPRALAGELRAECEATLAEDLVLCLDDAHLLAGSQGEVLIGELITNGPPELHLVVASRHELEVPLGRLRASGQLGEISESDLAFSREEARAFVEGQGRAVGAAQADELLRVTEGWPAGFALAVQATARGHAPRQVEGEHLFAYLAEEVLADLPEELRAFLEATAVPERFTPELAVALTGSHDPSALIAEARRRRLFLRRLPEETEVYGYHALFRRLLRQRLRQDGGERLRALEGRAGRALLIAGQAAEAIPHLIAAGLPEEAAAALEPIAESLATSPRAGDLAGWLRAIPAEIVERFPRIALAEGHLALGLAEYEAALEAAGRAYPRLCADRDWVGAARAAALVSQTVFAQAGGRREEGVDRAVAMLSQIPAGTSGLGLVRLQVAVGLALLGRFEDTFAEVEAVRALDDPNPAVVAFSRYLEGFWVQNHLHGPLAALPLISEAILRMEARDADPLAFAPFVIWGRGQVLNELGRAEEALRQAELMAEVAARRGVLALHMVGIRWLRMLALAELRRWKDLAAEIELAEPLFAPGAPGGGHRQHYESFRAMLAASRGDGQAVREASQQARAAAVTAESPYEQALVQIALSNAYADVGLFPMAQGLADEALQLAEGLGTLWCAVRAALAGARVHGESQKGDDHLAHALEVTTRRGFEELWDA